MNSKTVYILHKQGANSHYIGLEFLLRENGYDLEYREFSVLSNFFKSIKSLNGKKIVKQFLNLGFMIRLLFSKNKKIVLGIAPFDSKLGLLLRVLKNHKVYYHTSWTCWDKSFHPKRKNNSEQVFQTWKNFLEVKAEHIFCVTEKTKSELLQNYKLDESKTSIVYHALDPAFLTKYDQKKKEKSFIYYGRMVSRKGVEELLSFFAKNPEASLTLIGDGNQKKLVETYANAHQNITYHKQTSDKKELIKMLAQHQYMVLNAKQEELFGLIIIESMSQGVIPIATAHTGPKEIISPQDGILFREGELSTALSELIQGKDSMSERALQCLAKAKFYSPQNIANRWQEILHST